MNKLFTKIAGAVLGIALTIGVGFGAGQHEPLAVHAAGGTTATLSPSKVTSAGTLKDDKNGAWNFTYVADTTPTSETSGIHVGTNNKAATSISLETTDYASYTIESVSVCGAAKASTNAKAYIFIGGEQVAVSSSILGNTFNSGGTKLSFDNTSAKKSGAIKVSVDRGNSAKGALYINKVQVVYSEGASAETYTVSFNANGGGGTMSDVSGVSGSYTLPANGFTAPDNKAFAGWKAGNTGDTIAAGGSYTVSANVTFYAQWADAYTVTYTAGTNGSGSYAHTLQPEGTYTLLDFTNLTGVSANSGYRFKDYTVGGVSKDAGDTITLSAATSVAVNFEEQPLETTYDFTKNFSTYSDGWSGYSTHEGLDGVDDIGGDYKATIDLYKVSKQASTITDRPVFATKTTEGYTKVLQFSLNETEYKIKEIIVTFKQWTTKTPTVALFKGNTTDGTALDTAEIGTKNTLNVSDLNGLEFAIGYCDGETSNIQSGLTSIYISLTPMTGFGSTDHIKVTSLPNTIYHVGETYDSEGLTVTAYDSADEESANFEVITNSENLSISIETGYTFDESDVPGLDIDIEYQESGNTYATSFHIDVYALAKYELVTEEPTNWSGNYLIVGTNESDETVALDGSLTILDDVGNYKKVTADENNIITAGQELEWAISEYDTGYSIKGKSNQYIGKETTGSNSLDSSGTALVNGLSFADGVVTISGAKGDYKLSFNADGNRFRYYASGSVKLYKLVESDAALEFAQSFLGYLGETCEMSGNTVLEDLQIAWALVSMEFSELSNSDKQIFSLGVADESGDTVNQALALYDFVATKYGTQLESEDCHNFDFMSRGITQQQSSNRIILANNSQNSISLIVIATVVMSGLIIGYFALRKRKEQ